MAISSGTALCFTTGSKMDPQAPLLLRKASEDRAALIYDLPDGIFGFLAQQAFEKLLKSLIAANGETFDRTHDLDVLFKQVTSLGEDRYRCPIRS